MVGAEQPAKQVRHHQADEADQPGGRHRERGGQRTEDERAPLQALDVDPELLGTLFAGGEGVEVARRSEQREGDRDSGGPEGDEGQRIRARDASHEVEDDGGELFARGHALQKVDQRGAEGVEDRPGQQQREDGQPAAGGGDALDRDQRGERADEGRERHTEAGDAGEQRDDAAEARPSRDSEDVGVGERVAQQRLERDAGDAEQSAERRRGEHPRQAEREEDRPLRVAPDAAQRRRCQRRNLGRAEAHRDGDRERQQHAEPEGHERQPATSVSRPPARLARLRTVASRSWQRDRPGLAPGRRPERSPPAAARPKSSG